MPIHNLSRPTVPNFKEERCTIMLGRRNLSLAQLFLLNVCFIRVTKYPLVRCWDVGRYWLLQSCQLLKALTENPAYEKPISVQKRLCPFGTSCLAETFFCPSFSYITSRREREESKKRRNETAAALPVRSKNGQRQRHTNQTNPPSSLPTSANGILPLSIAQ